MLALLALFAPGGCVVGAPGDDVSYSCRSDGDCAAGFVCRGEPASCVSVAAAGDAGSAVRRDAGAHDGADAGPGADDAGGLVDAAISDPDAGTLDPDSGIPSDSALDAGVRDAGGGAAGALDAGPLDAGGFDAGAVDAGDFDAGAFDAGVVDAGDVDAGAGPVDSDGDGLLDEVDNCPARDNPEQHDEDLDGVGDPCDNCPGTSNASQSDVGELALGELPDGVGDACDPRPASSGDAIVLFDAFAGATSVWQTFNGGSWAVVNDRLSQLTSSAGQVAWHQDLMPARLALETVVRHDASASSSNAGLVFELKDNMSSSFDLDLWTCAVARFPEGDGLFLWYVDNGGAGGPSGVSSFSVQAGVGYRLTALVDGNQIRCGRQSPPMEIDVLTTTHPGRRVGFRANRVPASFDYLVVYALGP